MLLRRTYLLTALVVVCFILLPQVSAQFVQQGKLVAYLGTGAASGSSVSLSADGNEAIVGSPTNTVLSQGNASVFTRSGGVWSQQNCKLVGGGAIGQSEQGSSVSLSGDGNTAIVGGPGDNSNWGAVWVWGENEKPIIVSIKDIPDDQGGKVRLTWNRIPCDTAYDANKISSYGVWRRIPSGISLSKSTGLKKTSKIMNDTLGTLYDWLANVQAVQSPSYNVVVQTLSDSTSAGNYMETYLVTAHSSDPNSIWISQSDSGYSWIICFPHCRSLRKSWNCQMVQYSLAGTRTQPILM